MIATKEYIEGKMCRKLGIARTENPHEHNSEKYDHWDFGWWVQYANETDVGIQPPPPPSRYFVDSIKKPHEEVNLSAFLEGWDDYGVGHRKHVPFKDEHKRRSYHAGYDLRKHEVEKRASEMKESFNKRHPEVKRAWEEANQRWEKSDVNAPVKSPFYVDGGLVQELPKGQTKKMSMAEVMLSTVIGYVVNVAGQVSIFPLFGIHVSILTNMWIGVVFTFVSVARSYAVRRLFNWLHTRS